MCIEAIDNHGKGSFSLMTSIRAQLNSSSLAEFTSIPIRKTPFSALATVKIYLIISMGSTALRTTAAMVGLTSPRSKIKRFFSRRRNASRVPECKEDKSNMLDILLLGNAFYL
jgi:hypothetical protein